MTPLRTPVPHSWLVTPTYHAIASLLSLIAINSTPAPAAVPDPVLQWVGITNDAVLAGGTSPLATTRVVALVTASMFDAVNGIRPHYQALYVQPHVPGHASRRAAAVQAAYVVLSTVYPL